jgi:two-component system, cell cycle response regulator
VTTPAGTTALAKLRHDLRTPVNAILGYSALLLDDAPDANASAPLRSIEAAGGRLLALLAGVVDEASLQAARTAAGEPLGAVRAALEALRAHGAYLDMQADLARIAQAVVNLGALLERAHTDGAEAQPAAHAVAWPPRTRAAARQEAGGGRVLVVDDNDANRDLLSRRLTQHGHTATAAGDGDTALRMVRGGEFDVILLDIQMPGMDGFEVMAHLQEDPALAELPVIVISADAQLESAVRAIELGADDYLPKPFEPVLLRARVERALARKRARDVERSYLADVARLTGAALAVRDGQEPDAAPLEAVAGRQDDLGELARTFRRMLDAVQAREARLHAQVQALNLEIDEARKSREVSAITDTEYFRALRAKAQALREER